MFYFLINILISVNALNLPVASNFRRVCFFSDPNFKGKEECVNNNLFGPDGILEVGGKNTYSLSNNQISSIQVDFRCNVKIYDEFESNSNNLKLYSSVNDLKTVDFDNKIYKAIINCGKDARKMDPVCFYTGKNFKTSELCLGEGDKINNSRTEHMRLYYPSFQATVLNLNN